MTTATTCTPRAHAPAPASTGTCPHNCNFPRCNGTTGSGRCRKQPIKGASVCRTHGGSAPQVRAAAERAVVEAEAEKVLARVVWNRDAQPVTNAVGAMQLLAGQLQHAADVLGSRLESGEPPCEHCGRGDMPMDSPAAVAWLRVLREDRQLLEAMERLGIAERYVQLEADRVRLVAAAVGRVFEVLGLDVEQRKVGLQVLLAELRAAEPVPALPEGQAS